MVSFFNDNIVPLAFLFGFSSVAISEILTVFLYTRFWEKPCKRRCGMWSCKEYKHCIFSNYNTSCFSCKRFIGCEGRKKYLPDFGCDFWLGISQKEFNKRFAKSEGLNDKEN